MLATESELLRGGLHQGATGIVKEVRRSRKVWLQLMIDDEHTKQLMTPLLWYKSVEVEPISDELEEAFGSGECMASTDS